MEVISGQLLRLNRWVRLHDLFVTDNLTDKDMINYACTVRDKLAENAVVMKQIANNTAEQALLGDFPQAIDDAVMESSEAHQEMSIFPIRSWPEGLRGWCLIC